VKAIVTVKVSRPVRHDPFNKKTGPCPVNPEMICTDVTGEHHSYIETGNSLEHIRNLARAKFGHVTRIEEIKE